MWSVCPGGGEEQDWILTGGGDAGLSRWKLTVDNQAEQLQCGIAESDFPKHVQFLGSSIYVFTNSGHLINIEKGRAQSVYHDESFSSYAVLAANRDGLILIAGLQGNVTLLETQNHSTVLNSHFINGKVFAAALFSQEFLLNGPDGLLVIYRFSREGVTERLAEGRLPEAKQRWFSAFETWKSDLVLGDRVGSLHILDKRSLAIKQTFKKIHGRNGVTDIKSLG